MRLWAYRDLIIGLLLKLFKCKYFLVKYLIFSQDLEVLGILIGQYSDHMAK